MSQSQPQLRSVWQRQRRQAGLHAILLQLLSKYFTRSYDDALADQLDITRVWAHKPRHVCVNMYFLLPNPFFLTNSMSLVSVLESAASADPVQRQIGEEQLRSLEQTQGFYTSLLGIYSESGVPESSRYLAIIYFKNAVERHWRLASKFSVDEKAMIRSQLLRLVVSPITVASPRMAKQIGVVIAAISRADFPRLWPELLQDLNASIIEAANGASIDLLTSLLEVMHQTLKKLSSARIGQSRVLFNEFSISQIGLYWQIFISFKLYSALKIVGTLLYDGHDRIHRYDGPRQVFEGLLPLLNSSQQNDRIARRVGKIYDRLVNKHPLAFCGFRESAMKAAEFYCDFLSSQPEIETDGRPGPVIQSMYLVLDLTRLAKSKDRAVSSLPLNMRPRDEADQEDLQTAYLLVSSLFTESRIITIVEALIQYYFQMTPADIELWQEDPGEFVIEESRQNPEFSTPLCAEMLFAHLLKTWPDLVAPRAQMLIEEAVRSGNEIKVEAALRALEFGGATFSESFDIAPIVQLVGQSTSPLIRRRLCLVVGGWIPVRGAELQRLAFELVKSTLESEWDIVVQLGALELVRICCDDVEFQPELFEIAAERVFTIAYGLLQAAQQSTEVKIQVLKVLGIVVEGLNVHLGAVDVARLLEILPSLWATETEHSNHHLVQGAVLQTLAHLVNAVGVSSVSLEQSFTVSLPLIDVATDLSQPISSYLLEDGLAVWKALLSNAPQTATPLLAPLFERLLLLIESKTEYLGLSLSLLESYMWLDYRLAVDNYPKLFGLFSIYLNDGCAMDEALLILLCVEVIMMMATKSSGEFGQGGSTSLEAQEMQKTGLNLWLEQCLLRAGDEDAVMDVLIQAGKSINVLSFLSLQTSGSAILHPDRIFPIWLAKLRGISDPRDRKLGAMGVSAMLLAHPELFPPNSALYVEAMSAVVEEVPDSAGFNEFYYANQDDDQKSAEERRQQAARNEEFPVVVGLQAFIKHVAQHNQQHGRPELGATATQMGIIKE